MNTYTLPNGTDIDLCDDCEEDAVMTHGIELTNRTPACGLVCEWCGYVHYPSKVLGEENT